MPLLRADPPEHAREPVTVRAIQPNAGLQAWYFAELNRAIEDMAASLRKTVLSAYGQTEPPEFASDAARNPSLLLRSALRRWGGLWVSKFDKLSLDLGQEFAKRAFGLTQRQMKAALKDAGFTVKFTASPGVQAAYQAVVAEQVNLIKSIPQQYLKDVESKVWNSVMKGADMHALSVDLRKTYGVTRDRAATIARDQNHKAKAIIEKTRREELGITHAIWIHSAGGKTPRRTHVDMHGKPYPIAQGMWDPDQKAYVMPGELINCRCVSKAVVNALETPGQAARKFGATPLLRAAGRRAR